MARKIQIECVVKGDWRDAAARIKAVGGAAAGGWWKHKQDDAILWIEDGTFKYHVLGHDQKEIKVVVAQDCDGRKYLKTEADGEQPNILLNLPECS